MRQSANSLTILVKPEEVKAVDVPVVIKHRLNELGLEQKDLAVAAQVTESYISQLLAGKKLPPAPDRTEIYDRLGKVLKLPGGELSKLAHLQRREELRKRVLGPPSPLFKDLRALLLRKCESQRHKEVAAIFEKEPFGTLERLITQKLVEAVREVTGQGLESKAWLNTMAGLTKQSVRGVRRSLLKLSELKLSETGILPVSIQDCGYLLEAMIESWDIDMKRFAIDIVFHSSLAAAPRKRFEFIEREPDAAAVQPPGYEAFLKDPALSGDAGKEELDFLASLRFPGRNPTALYYYRELQNLRDPLHFRG